MTKAEKVNELLALIKMQQVDFLQVFLPYVLVDANRTFYSAIKEKNYLALPETSDV